MIAEIVQSLAHAAEPWKNLYADSRPIGVAVLFGHLGALLVGGGVAVSTDLVSLRAFRADVAERRRQLDVLHQAHRIVIGSLIVFGITGLLMAASDVATFLVSPWFWIKLGFVALLLINGAVLYRTGVALRQDGEGDDPRWGRLHTVSILSLVLWIATVLAGTILQAAA